VVNKDVHVHLVEVCVSVRMHDNLKTTAGICFLLGILSVLEKNIEWVRTSRSQLKVIVRRVQGHSLCRGQWDSIWRHFLVSIVNDL